MFTKKSVVRLFIAVFIILMISGPAAASPLLAPNGTSFTYQGKLTDSGVPANGTYALQYKLYDSLSGGAQVGSTLTQSSVTVTNGLFTVQLDFGNVFNGTALYLEIGVRPGGSGGAYTTLTPRQPLSPTPYSMFAANSALLNGLNAASFALASHMHWGETWSGTGTGLTLSGGSIGLSGSGSNYGLLGNGGNTGTGVYGTTTSSTGAGVTGSGGTGVVGSSTAANGYGVLGINNSTTGTGSGVYGQTNSTSGYGVSGINTGITGTGVYGSGDTIGVYGASTNHTGVLGSGPTGVVGYTTSGNGNYAGYFSGNVDVEGNVYVDGNQAVTGTKSAVVKTQDYGTRTLYAVESPENWFQDFGTGQLTNGSAVITIDPIFAETVNMADDYHVFLTPMGDCALYVTDKTPTTFTVRALGGQTCSIAFDYNIVAKRLGYENVRLAVVNPLPAVGTPNGGTP